jgi:hypothetical protein
MSARKAPIAVFRLGRIVSTPNALGKLEQSDILLALQRHQAGDWGDVNEQDRETNDRALSQGTRLFSIYHSAKQLKFWVITEADRSATTVLLPEDY